MWGQVKEPGDCCGFILVKRNTAQWRSRRYGSLKLDRGRMKFKHGDLGAHLSPKQDVQEAKQLGSSAGSVKGENKSDESCDGEIWFCSKAGAPACSSRARKLVWARAQCGGAGAVVSGSRAQEMLPWPAMQAARLEECVIQPFSRESPKPSHSFRTSMTTDAKQHHHHGRTHCVPWW